MPLFKMGNQMSSMTYYILIFGAISTCTFHIEDQLCKPGICNNGDCFHTTDSIIIGSEIDGHATKCPYGFDHHKGLCYRVDKVKKSWFKARDDDTENDQLAKFSFLDNRVRSTAAEYLKSKLSGDQSPVWINLLWQEVSTIQYTIPPCFALEPANYTHWEARGCMNTLYSLRTAPLGNLSNNNKDIMCRCRPGYTGRWCNITDTQLSNQELTNPDALQCPRNKLVFIEFAVYGYRASVSTAKECFTLNVLPLLRYLCQGMNNCKLGPPFRSKYILPFCSEPDATLTVRYSCVNASELSCPRNTKTIADEKSINCIRSMYQNVSWKEAMDFCLENGGQLAALSREIHYNFGVHSIFSRAKQSFWVFDEQPEIRPDPREPEECTMATKDNTKPNTRIQVVRDCSKKLPGLCAIPPYHPASTIMEDKLQPTEALMANTSHILCFDVITILACIIFHSVGIRFLLNCQWFVSIW